MKESEVYEEVRRQAFPHMEAFMTDLDIDREAICQNPGVPFLHFTGTTGTNLELFHPSEWYPPAGEHVPYLFSTAERHHILKGVVITVECMKKVSRQELILYYDGKTIKKLLRIMPRRLPGPIVKGSWLPGELKPGGWQHEKDRD